MDIFFHDHHGGFGHYASYAIADSGPAIASISAATAGRVSRGGCFRLADHSRHDQVSDSSFETPFRFGCGGIRFVLMCSAHRQTESRIPDNARSR